MNAETAADKKDALLLETLTYEVIGRSFRVQNRLGFGFVENVYLGAFEHELRKAGLAVEREVPIAVWYDGIIVGSFRMDLLIEHKLIVEVKACPPDRDHEVQLLNYLRATDIELGLLIYFGRRVTYNRLVYSNSNKPDIKQKE